MGSSGRRVEDGAVQGRPGDSKAGGYFGNRDVSSFEQCSDCLDLFGGGVWLGDRPFDREHAPLSGQQRCVSGSDYVRIRRALRRHERPAFQLVSEFLFSPSEIRSGCWVSSSAIRRTRSARFLPSRSSRHTTNVSPSRRLLRQASSCSLLQPGGVLASGMFSVSLAAPGAFQRVLLQIHAHLRRTLGRSRYACPES